MSVCVALLIVIAVVGEILIALFLGKCIDVMGR
jgi:hypothetical protein